MAVTSATRIEIAKEFVRIGYGDVVDHSPFRSLDFLTEELTTAEVQAVLPIVKEYNAFDGQMVSNAIEAFKGRMLGWMFGRSGSPYLVAVLAPWTHQLEEVPPRANVGRKFSDEEVAALVAELRSVMVDKLAADEFGPHGDTDMTFGAWWD